jgi:hypothetical protein
MNNQVLQLMQSYPELAKYINNNNGLLKIEQEGYDALIKAQEKMIKETSLTTTGSQIGLYGANIEKTFQNLLKDLDTDDIILQREKTGEGDDERSLYDYEAREREETLIKAVVDAYSNNPNLFNKEDSEELRKVIEENSANQTGETDKLVENLQKNSEAIINATSAINNYKDARGQVASQYISQ